MRTRHRRPTFAWAYGTTCFCPLTAMVQTHSESGGSSRMETTSRMSLRAVRWTCGPSWSAHFSCDGASGRSKRATTVHIRNVLGGLPDRHQTHGTQTQSESGARRRLWSVKFAPNASRVLTLCSHGAPQTQQCAPGDALAGFGEGGRPAASYSTCAAGIG